jgi:hypothetical protein
VKVRDWLGKPYAFSLRAGFLYLDANALAGSLTKNAGSVAGLIVLPLEASASFRFTDRFSQSFQLTYVAMGVAGDLPGGTDIGGAAATSNAALSTLYEFRVSRVVALDVSAKMQIYEGPVRFSGHFTRNGVSVDTDLGAPAHYRTLRWNVVPGVAFSWSHVNLVLGVGYGSIWLPFLELPTAGATVVPQLDFYVRF